jgi:molecular chaperone GrpE
MDTPEAKTEVAVDPVVEAPPPATVTAELEQLRKERDELRDLAQRSRAEFDNYRRRVDREKAEMLDHGAADAVRQILVVVDDFNRALQVETQDKNYSKGVELIHQRFTETLKKLGLTPIETEGKTFDPNIHYAVDMTPTDEAEDQTILAEYQKGYFFKGKLLRPAMVKVAVKK